MRVLIICHVKLMQSTALEQKHLELQSLSPTLPNPWLLPVLFKYIIKEYKCSLHSSGFSVKFFQEIITDDMCILHVKPFPFSFSNKASQYIFGLCGKKLGSVGAGCSPETKNINGSQIENLNFLSVWFSRDWKFCLL